MSFYHNKSNSRKTKVCVVPTFEESWNLVRKKKSNCSLLVLEIVGGREGFLEEVGLGPWSLQPLIHLSGPFSPSGCCWGSSGFRNTQLK